MKASPDSTPYDGLEAPNHTQVPNALFDDLMHQMKEAELRVTLAICRFTFGWHKKEDEISLTTLQKITGLSRQGVIQGIEAAMERGTVRRRPRGQSFVYRLRLVNVVDQLPANNETARRKTPKVVNVVDQSDRPASQLSGLAEGVTSQLSGPELVNYVDTQKKGNKDHESPPPTMTHDRARNGGGDGGDLFRELRRRGVGQTKARQIADMGGDATAILHAIDTRPEPHDPRTMGRVINDILDGVATDRVVPVRSGAPLSPPARLNLPDTAVSPAAVLRLAGERNDHPS